MPPLWPHQEYAHAATVEAISAGYRRILITSPTGGGKTTMMRLLIESFLDRGLNCGLYSNRKLLIEQTSTFFKKIGIEHGIRASGHEQNHHLPVQISSVQTESRRVLKAEKNSLKSLHKGDLVIIDEAHVQTGNEIQEIVRRHMEDGAAVVGYTATPIDLGDIYQKLIVAGNNSELRKCGALVRAIHYGPDEPDVMEYRKLKAAQKMLEENITQKQASKLIMNSTIWGRVFHWYKRLNPHCQPGILFAPGVKESRWFAEQFNRAGIPSAHIDSKEIWINGQEYKTCKTARKDLIAKSKDGTIRIICNRYVMREGIDLPWLVHGILATIFNLQSYLQSGGRLLRSCLGKKECIIQDHGGNWWRHGSLNADRAWHLEDTLSSTYGIRANRIRQRKEKEPFRCPQCGIILGFGDCCPVELGGCGFKLIREKTRPVIQLDGTLSQMTGDIFRPRRLCRKDNVAKLWEKVYWRAKSKKWDATFAQAEAVFARENNWTWPPRWLPFMPRNEGDFYQRVAKVPLSDLIEKPDDP